MSGFSEILERLAATIESRKGGDTGASYTAQLLSDRGRAAKKLGEEAVETALAAVSGDKQALVAESADLLYHLLVVLETQGVPLSEVYAELERRTARSGIDEKESRSRA